MDFSTKLVTVREHKGWGVTEAARNIGIGHGLLQHLEGLGRKQVGAPSKITLSTSVKLIEAYWPELKFSDFGVASTIVICRDVDGDGVLEIP